MDRSGDRDPGAPGQRAWTQGPWHGAEANPGPADRGPWEAAPGPAGQGPWDDGPWQSGGGYPGTWNPGAGEGVFGGDWTVATMAARTLARRVMRFLLLSTLAGAAVAAGLIALAVAVWPNPLLVVLLVLLAVPVLLVTVAMGTVGWIGRRAWRSGAWLEAVPAAAGMPWLSRVIWAIRAAVGGKAFRRRGRRPSYQARAGDLSGTTR